ncbi:hypothetical protein F7725_022940 [Dissostichus mawsoni]|uniref:Uncharacterized protein n=1 Tax=Dissostichus mawsoni TaxID=36200 RepID=A0A7J5YZA8_DISMA|nr:hypothetical protein F7725_022940 [Dissostichus mawsoni]
MQDFLHQKDGLYVSEKVFGNVVVAGALWRNRSHWEADGSGRRNFLPPLLSRALLPPPPQPVTPICFSHMTEEPPEQLGLGILVSRAILCPLSLSPVCPIATSTDSQHQLIIATVAEGEGEEEEEGEEQLKILMSQEEEMLPSSPSYTIMQFKGLIRSDSGRGAADTRDETPPPICLAGREHQQTPFVILISGILSLKGAAVSYPHSRDNLFIPPQPAQECSHLWHFTHR